MKLNTAPSNPVEMSGVCSTKQFTIQATAKSFQILSDGLYSNKIRAIIRELSTNAYDSHVAAGKAQVPFTVNIPNVLAPWFSVRDYGVGLSHDEVLSIYTSYFTSTKSDSDDFVGALGLGCLTEPALLINSTRDHLLIWQKSTLTKLECTSIKSRNCSKNLETSHKTSILIQLYPKLEQH